MNFVYNLRIYRIESFEMLGTENPPFRLCKWKCLKNGPMEEG